MRAVSNSIHLPMDPESAIGLFLDENHLQGWWRVEGCLVEPRAGGVYTLAWEVTPEGLGYVTSGIIEEVGAGILRIGSVVYLNPRRPILGPMTLAVTAKTIAGGCDLTVVQGGYREGPNWDWYHDAVRNAWPVVLSALADYAGRDGR